MSTTLTNGLKLPDKGSVDWYADMQSNYTILDGAVGTVAEHTSQIAGKAPAVHTHTKSDVTDLLNSNFIPSANNSYDLGSSSYQWNNAYIKSLTINGVACGDILTHNASEFVGVSGNQTIDGIKTFSNIIYGLGSQIILRRNDVERTVLPASTVYTAFSFNDKSGVGTTSRFSAVENIVKTNGDINLDLRAYDFSTKSNTHTTVVLERKYDGTSSFYPETNNAVNLGTSANKWKSVYSDSYYYGTTAWGLDKANVWTAQQNITGNNSRGSISIYNSAYTKGGTLSVTDLSIGSIYMGDGGQQGLANSLGFISTDLASNGARTLLSLSAIENTASSGARTNVVIQYDKNDAVNPQKVAIAGTVIPNTNATFSLGTSTAKWKNLNGINPGALSLPNLSDPDPIDTRNWVASTPTNNAYTPSENGWLNVVVTDSLSATANEFSIYVKSTNFFATAVHKLADIDDNKGKVGLFIPVMAGITYYVVAKGNISGAIISATFFPCLGSV